MNDKGVCKTAQAKPGLLNIKVVGAVTIGFQILMDIVLYIYVNK